MAARRKLILVVFDGLTPAVFEDAIEGDAAPALSFLAATGDYRRGVSTFPSLTPVCLSSISTGGHPDIHRIPHLVWYHRGERRIVDYGSSFAALRAAGTRRSILDAIFNMNEQHLAPDAVTIYEALEDEGFVFFVFYLPDYDFASHVRGPEGAHEALARSDRAVGTLMDAAGGPDEFLERYAVVVCADHGQTGVDEAYRLQDRYAGAEDVVVTASNRAGMVYRLDGCRLDARELAARLDDEPAA